jgi:hypothetical protein
MANWNDAAEFCAKLSQQEAIQPFYLRADETITTRDLMAFERHSSDPELRGSIPTCEFAADACTSAGTSKLSTLSLLFDHFFNMPHIRK